MKKHEGRLTPRMFSQFVDSMKLTPSALSTLTLTSTSSLCNYERHRELAIHCAHSKTNLLIFEVMPFAFHQLCESTTVLILPVLAERRKVHVGFLVHTRKDANIVLAGDARLKVVGGEFVEDCSDLVESDGAVLEIEELLAVFEDFAGVFGVFHDLERDIQRLAKPRELALTSNIFSKDSASNTTTPS